MFPQKELSCLKMMTFTLQVYHMSLLLSLLLSFFNIGESLVREGKHTLTSKLKKSHTILRLPANSYTSV